MDLWVGSAGVCINHHGEVLMVRQGKEDEEKLWAIPAGGVELNETSEECCIREVFEETGYEVEIVRPLYIKTGKSFGIDIKVQYFEVMITGGEPRIQDPDGLIHEIAWKKLSDMNVTDFGFPEDLAFLLNFIREKSLQEIEGWSD
ncbi:NUDIX hydrolase [Bacillus sp. JJ1609]|uniref:NUDIX hydrolase n=1 Tax=Bacillus sp. JJ1609 TaxID=3122977 RepID=UPI003000EB4D